MRWVAPTEKDTANETLEKRLWAAADQLRANSGLTSAQYSTPVLGLIFLRFAEARARACGVSKLMLTRDGFELNLEWLAK
jgi:hypothetical protein